MSESLNGRCACVCVCVQEMTLEERMLITDLNKCDFGELHAMHKEKVEARKNMSKEDKLVCTPASRTIGTFCKRTELSDETNVSCLFLTLSNNEHC